MKKFHDFKQEGEDFSYSSPRAVQLALYNAYLEGRSDELKEWYIDQDESSVSLEGGEGPEEPGDDL